MTEDEQQELLGTVAEAHAGLSEVVFKLRAPKQAPGGRPHSGEGSVTHRRQPLKSQKRDGLLMSPRRRRDREAIAPPGPLGLHCWCSALVRGRF